MTYEFYCYTVHTLILTYCMQLVLTNCQVYNIQWFIVHVWFVNTFSHSLKEMYLLKFLHPA